MYSLLNVIVLLLVYITTSDATISLLGVHNKKLLLYLKVYSYYIYTDVTHEVLAEAASEGQINRKGLRTQSEKVPANVHDWVWGTGLWGVQDPEKLCRYVEYHTRSATHIFGYCVQERAVIANRETRTETRSHSLIRSCHAFHCT